MLVVTHEMGFARDVSSRVVSCTRAWSRRRARRPTVRRAEIGAPAAVPVAAPVRAGPAKFAGRPDWVRRYSTAWSAPVQIASINPETCPTNSFAVAVASAARSVDTLMPGPVS